MLDCEHTGPNQVRDRYRAMRPDFGETLPPSLRVGWNLGAQIYWQQQTYCSVLGAVFGKPVYVCEDATGTSLDAAMLFDMTQKSTSGDMKLIAPLKSESLVANAQKWHQ